MKNSEFAVDEKSADPPRKHRKDQFDFALGAGIERDQRHTNSSRSTLHLLDVRLSHGVGWIDEQTDRLAAGTSSCSSSRRFASSVSARIDVPVTLPPGWLRLVVRPSSTGSPASKTTGIVPAADFAARAAMGVIAAMTATPRRASSPAKTGKRAYCASAKRYRTLYISPFSIALFGKSRAESGCKWSNRAFRSRIETTNPPQRPLLRERRERPHPRAAKSRDEVAPSHSILLPARSRTGVGTSMPTASPGQGHRNWRRLPRPRCQSWLWSASCHPAILRLSRSQ